MRKKIASWIVRLAKEDADPHHVASGAAIGTFISIMPTPGVNILLCLLVAFLYRHVNKLALFAPLVIWNPFTVILLYPASYHLGDFLFGQSEVVVYNLALMDQIFYYSRRFLVGHTIISASIAAATYGLVFWLVARDRSYRR